MIFYDFGSLFKSISLDYFMFFGIPFPGLILDGIHFVRCSFFDVFCKCPTLVLTKQSNYNCDFLENALSRTNYFCIHFGMDFLSFFVGFFLKFHVFSASNFLRFSDHVVCWIFIKNGSQNGTENRCLGAGGHQESISFRWASFWEVLWSFRLVSALCLVHVGSLGAPFSDDVGDFGRLLDHCYSIRHRFGIIFAPNACFLNPWWRPNTILVSLSCSRHPKFQHCGTFPIRAPCLLRKNIDLDTV